MRGWQVKLCDRTVIHGPYLSALEIKGYINASVYLNFTYFTRQTLHNQKSGLSGWGFTSL